MPEASSNSTLTIPGGITQDTVLLDSDLANTLGVTGATVNGGTGNAINANTYYQPVDARQIIQGRTVVPIGSGSSSSGSSTPSLASTPLPAIPDLTAFRTPDQIDIAPITAGIRTETPGIQVPSAPMAKPIVLKPMTAQIDTPPPPSNTGYVPDDISRILGQQPRPVTAPPRIMPPPRPMVAPPIAASVPMPPGSMVNRAMAAGQRFTPEQINQLQQQGVDNFLKKQGEGPAGPMGTYFTPEAIERFSNRPDLMNKALQMMQPRKDFRGRLSKALHRLGAGLNDNVARVQAAEAEAKAQYIKQMVADDNANWRQISSNLTEIQKQSMDIDARKEIAKINAGAQGKLTQKQAHDLAKMAITELDPSKPAELSMQEDFLMAAQAVTGVDYTKYIGNRTKAGADEAKYNSDKIVHQLGQIDDQAYKATQRPVAENQADAKLGLTKAQTGQAVANTKKIKGETAMQPERLTGLRLDNLGKARALPGIAYDTERKGYQAEIARNEADPYNLALKNHILGNRAELSDSDVRQIPDRERQLGSNADLAQLRAQLEQEAYPFDLNVRKNRSFRSDQGLVLGDQRIAQGRMLEIEQDQKLAAQLRQDAIVALTTGDMDKAKALAIQSDALLQRAGRSAERLRRADPTELYGDDLKRIKRQGDSMPMLGNASSPMVKNLTAIATQNVLQQNPGARVTVGQIQAEAKKLANGLGYDINEKEIKHPVAKTKYVQLTDPNSDFVKNLVSRARNKLELQHGATSVTNEMVRDEARRVATTLGFKLPPVPSTRRSLSPGLRVVDVGKQNASYKSTGRQVISQGSSAGLKPISYQSDAIFRTGRDTPGKATDAIFRYGRDLPGEQVNANKRNNRL